MRRTGWAAICVGLWVLAGIAVAPGRGAPGPAAASQPAVEPASAAWELRMLGVDTPDKLRDLRGIGGRRLVTLAVVGTGGVSESVLAPRAGRDFAVEYRMGARDPNGNTHDTQMVAVTSDITLALGVRLKVLVYQPPDSPAELAEAFRQAGKAADIICFYQSYWEGIGPILDALREANLSVILTPYAEVGDPRTSRTPQGHSRKPGGGGIGHLATVAPLARKSGGELTTVADRDPNDTEIINFVAPSYHANGPGGTCPSAAVAVAAACYVYAASPARPTPAEALRVLRETSCIDGNLIASTPPFSRETAVRFEKAVREYTQPERGARRRLDAPGLLNLHRAFLRMGKPGEKTTTGPAESP